MKRIVHIYFILMLSIFTLTRVTRAADMTIDEKYKAGVKSFLEGDSRKAISFLSDVVSEDASNEKANTLLLKLYVKEINAAVSAKRFSEAKRLHAVAIGKYPNDQNLILLSAAIKPPPPPPVVEAPPPAPKREELPPRPVEKKRTVEKAEPVAPPADVAPSKPVIALPVPVLPAPEKPGLAVFVGLILGSVIFILVLSIIIILVLDRKKLWEKIELNESRFQKKEDESKALQNEIGTLKGQLQQKEEVLRGRNDELQRVRRQLEEKRKEVVVPPAPPVKERPAPAVTPMQNYAEYQEKQILDIVVDAPSLVKREAWVRIAERVIGLYQTSSEAALKFLEQLLKDPKPVVRMSIVEALVRIATPETLDIMLKMLKDPDFNVQREVIKGLKTILAEKIEQVPDAYRKKIQASLEQEVEQGGWVV